MLGTKHVRSHTCTELLRKVWCATTQVSHRVQRSFKLYDETESEINSYIFLKTLQYTFSNEDHFCSSRGFNGCMPKYGRTATLTGAPHGCERSQMAGALKGGLVKKICARNSTRTNALMSISA